MFEQKKFTRVRERKQEIFPGVFLHYADENISLRQTFLLKTRASGETYLCDDVLPIKN